MFERSLVAACRFYQRLFSANHPEAERLASVSAEGDEHSYYSAVHKFSKTRASALLRRFDRYSADWSQQSALEFGCGSGGMLVELAGKFRTVVGVDILPKDVEFAQRSIAVLGLLNAEAILYPGRSLPFSNDSFDAIVSIDVLEHVDDLDLTFREMLRVLRRGGRAYFSFGPLWKHPHGKHMWVTLPGWWTHLLFPRRIVMEVRGAKPQSSWQDLGLACLTVSKFDRVLRQSGFRVSQIEYRSKPIFKLLSILPFIREYVIAEIVCTLEKP